MAPQRVSPVAQGGGQFHPGAAKRLLRIRASRPQAHRTPPTARARPPRPGAHLAARPRGRRPPGPAGRPMPRGRDDRRRPRGPHPLRSPQTARARPGLTARGRHDGRAAQAGPLPPAPMARQASVHPRGRPPCGRDAAQVWGSPRRRDEAARTPRPESAAGPRWTPVRWSPPPREQRAHPSALPGSDASDGRQAPGCRR
jgi:hypothetical protein